MRRIYSITMMLFVVLMSAFAQGNAELTFEKTTHDFGTFSENDPVVTCKFVFKNTGDSPLVIHQAIASCGCTAPNFTKEPVKPGEKGEITVTYNGAGRFPGKFRKTVTVYSNAENEIVRIYIKGDMTPKNLDLQKAIEKTEKIVEQTVQESK